MTLPPTVRSPTRTPSYTALTYVQTIWSVSCWLHACWFSLSAPLWVQVVDCSVPDPSGTYDSFCSSSTGFLKLHLRFGWGSLNLFPSVAGWSYSGGRLRKIFAKRNLRIPKGFTPIPSPQPPCFVPLGCICSIYSGQVLTRIPEYWKGRCCLPPTDKGSDLCSTPYSMSWWYLMFIRNLVFFSSERDERII